VVQGVHKAGTERIELLLSCRVQLIVTDRNALAQNHRDIREELISLFSVSLVRDQVEICSVTKLVDLWSWWTQRRK